MTMLLSQKHYLVGGRLIEEFYAGEFHDAACIRKIPGEVWRLQWRERRRKQRGQAGSDCPDGRWNLGR